MSVVRMWVCQGLLERQRDRQRERERERERERVRARVCVCAHAMHVCELKQPPLHTHTHTNQPLSSPQTNRQIRLEAEDEVHKGIQQQEQA